MKVNISFLIKGNKLLEKYNEICKIIKNMIKREFVSEPVYNEKYLKAKSIKRNPTMEKTNKQKNYDNKIQ